MDNSRAFPVQSLQSVCQFLIDFDRGEVRLVGEYPEVGAIAGSHFGGALAKRRFVDCPRQDLGLYLFGHPSELHVSR